MMEHTMAAITSALRRSWIACALLCGCLAPALHAQRAGAAQFQVRSFYATTSGTTPYDTIDQWCQSDATCKPPKVGAFPGGQAVLDFYYSTNYQTQSVLDMQNVEGYFAVVLRTSGGRVFLRCTLSGFGNPSCDNPHAHGADRVYEGDGMIQLWAPQQPRDMQPSAFPDDTYTAQFLVNGRVAAHTTFRVGAKGAHPTVPAKAKVLALYPVAAQHATGGGQGGDPPRLATFPSASSTLYVYLRYRNFSTTMPVTLQVTQPIQRLPLAVVGPFHVTTPSGRGIISVPAPAGDGYYDGGTYTATLLAGTTGTPIAHVTFQVAY